MNPAENTRAPRAERAERQKLKEPEESIVNVSSKKDPKSYKLLVKLMLRKFGQAELRSLGNASESVVQLAESLVRNKFAVYEKIESGTVDLEDANNEAGTRKGVKFVVVLRKSPQFDELTKNLEELIARKTIEARKFAILESRLSY